MSKFNFLRRALPFSNSNVEKYQNKKSRITSAIWSFATAAIFAYVSFTVFQDEPWSSVFWVMLCGTLISAFFGVLLIYKATRPTQPIQTENSSEEEVN
jgi:drug/metabolite transporter (DMT)-like permease